MYPATPRFLDSRLVPEGRRRASLEGPVGARLNASATRVLAGAREQQPRGGVDVYLAWRRGEGTGGEDRTSTKEDKHLLNMCSLHKKGEVQQCPLNKGWVETDKHSQPNTLIFPPSLSFSYSLSPHRRCHCPSRRTPQAGSRVLCIPRCKDPCRRDSQHKGCSHGDSCWKEAPHERRLRGRMSPCTTRHC